MLQFLRNNKGITIVEVIVSGGMTAIVAVGIATMMSNSVTEQRKVVLLDTLKNQKMKFETLIRDQASWTNTLNATGTNNAALFNYLRSSSAVVTTGDYTPVAKITLYDAAGSAAMTSFLGPGETSGNGITEKGALCNSFSTTTGTDACPISYKVMIAADCSGATLTCANPQLKIVARLLYNPASSGTLHNFRNIIQTISGEVITDAVADGKYDASVKRTSASTNRSFRILARKTTANTTACTSGGYGTCSQGVSVVHPVNWDFEEYDTNDLVTVASTANIRFNETGMYGCTIAVPAFATYAFTATLRNVTAGVDVATGSTNAGLWTQSTAVIDAKFNVTNTAHNYQIFQRCESDQNPEYPSATACTLGFSSTYGTMATMSMSCYKLDRSM